MVSGKKGIYEENGGVNVKRIVCIGDSNTYGYDPRSFAGSRYPEGVRWTGILNAAGFEVINLGQNGLCIPPKVQFHLFQDMIRSYMPADVIIVMLGSNDLLNGSTVYGIIVKIELLRDFVGDSFVSKIVWYSKTCFDSVGEIHICSYHGCDIISDFNEVCNGR